MFICCAIGRPDSCPALLLLAGHSTCVLRWVGRGTRRSDRLPSPVLASLLPRTPHRSLSCSYSFAPNVSFFFWSVNNLRCWMATGQPTSCQAPSPKLLFLPDETLDFLNTTDARHLIVLFWCIVIIQYQRGMICCCCSRLWFMGFTPVFELFTGLISLHLTRSSTEDGDLKMI